MSHFFVSYSHNDRDFVEELDEQIEETELSLWIDRRQLKAGEEWRKAIDNAISNSDGVIVVISQDSLTSQYCIYEWSYAMGLGKIIIPILLKDEYESIRCEQGNEIIERKTVKIHPKIEIHQWENFVDESQRDWQKLIDRLKELAGTVPSFSPPVQEAITNLHSPNQVIRRDAFEFLNQKVDKNKAIEAYAWICNNEDFIEDVRLDATAFLAIKTDYTDRRCILAMQKILSTSDGIKWDVHSDQMKLMDKVLLIGEFHINEGMSSLLEGLHTTKVSFRGHTYWDSVLERILNALDKLHTDEVHSQLKKYYSEYSDFRGKSNSMIQLEKILNEWGESKNY